MSAPDTNIDKQKRRHRPSLIGIWVALAVAAVVVLLMIFDVFGDAEETVNTTSDVAPSTIEGTTATDANATDGTDAATTGTTAAPAGGTDAQTAPATE
ncbi:hypothetical protein AB1M95_06060 [Sulfitobacter sp. LCG007]